MGDPEVFKQAEVIAFQALITITAVAVVFQVICGSIIDAVFDVVDKWCKHKDKLSKEREKM